MTTLLTGVNDVLTRAKLIQGDSGTLTTLTDSPRQVWINQIIQIWNEVMEELYSTAEITMPKETAEATITLVTNTRAYALATYNTLYWPFRDTTNGEYIYEYPGDYLDLVNSQPIPADYTGLPRYGVIRTTDGYLYLDYIPTSNENGLVYTYDYDKDISMSAAADTFPFRDEVYRALVPVVAGLLRVENRSESMPAFHENMGRAARLLSDVTPRTHYGRSRPYGGTGPGNPYAE